MPFSGGHLEFQRLDSPDILYIDSIQFSDPQNLYLDTKIIILTPISAKILAFYEILGNLGGHLEYFKMLNVDRAASVGFLKSMVSGPRIH